MGCGSWVHVAARLLAGLLVRVDLEARLAVAGVVVDEVHASPVPATQTVAERVGSKIMLRDKTMSATSKQQTMG